MNKTKELVRTLYRFITTRRIGRSDCNHINCRLPKTTILYHGGIGVIIHRNTKLGQFVEIGPNVVIGHRNGKGPPTIESHVKIKVNATILGDINIGHHSVIGAGAVVLDDVPPYSLAVGNPARIITGKYKK